MKIDKGYKAFSKSLLMGGVGIFCALVTESAMATLTDYLGGVYTHGSAATLNPVSTKSKIQQLAEGSLITIKPGGQAIVDIAVPVPTQMYGIRTKLLSIEPRFDGDATIVGVLAQDGGGLIQAFEETWTGTETGSGPGGNGTASSANFAQPGPNLFSGLGVTLTIKNTCTGHKCKSQTMLITGVGADYYYTVP
jgi:hypothetical protein